MVSKPTVTAVATSRRHLQWQIITSNLWPHLRVVRAVTQVELKIREWSRTHSKYGRGLQYRHTRAILQCPVGIIPCLVTLGLRVQVGIRRWCLDTQAILLWNSPFTSTTKPSPEPTYQVTLMARSTPEASHPPIKDKMFATQRPVSPMAAAAKPLSSSSSDSDHHNLRDYLQEASNWVGLTDPTTPFTFFIKSFFILSNLYFNV